MSRFLTQCPFCETSFKVSEEQMQAANGVVRCGACMEVFLAGQHRIFLKDRPSDDLPENPHPVSEALSDTDIQDTDMESLDADTGLAWEVSDADDDESDEPDPWATAGLEAAEAADDEQSTLFTPWVDDIETGEVDDWESEISQDSEHESEKETEEEPEEEIEEEIEEEPEETIAEAIEEKSQEKTEEVIAEKTESLIEKESAEDTEEKSEEETNASVYNTFLNPGGYRMEKFSVDHILPRLSPSETDDESGATESPEAKEETKVEAKDEAEEETEEKTEGIAESLVEAGEEDFAETLPDDDTALDSIPTLVPDLVASEHIPAGESRPILAWFQSLRNTPADKDQALDDYSGSDEKARIRSHLSALEDEESLGPLELESLADIDAEPLELLRLQDPLRKWKTAAYCLGSLVLVLVLAGQLLWFNLESLVLDRRFDPITSLVCEYTSCPDTSVIQLTSLVTEELVVRSHPEAEDALLVNFIFRNDAPREQRFPLVELNFTDVSGKVVANRVFGVDEYLPAEMQLFTHMPAHSSIQVSLALVDPGETATGYSLVFRNP